MSSKHGTLVVFGSGPGVGRSTAALFAERGFEKVILISRNAKRLAQDADAVRSANSETTVYEIEADLANQDRVLKALSDITKTMEETALDCVLFNAARTGKSEFFDFSSTDLENDLKIAVVSLYTVAQWAIPKFLDVRKRDPSTTPSFLVTSGMLAKDPFPAMFSLAASKAAQYSLVHSLHKRFEPMGVHCGLVIIGGTVSDNSKVTNARNIANELWKMFEQESGQGKLEVMLSDPDYEDHVRNREK